MSRFILFILLIMSLRISLGWADEFDDFISSPLGAKPGVPPVKEVSGIKPVSKTSDGTQSSPSARKVPSDSGIKKYPPYKKSILEYFNKWTALIANPLGEKMCYAVVFLEERIGNFPSNKPSADNQEKLPYFMVHYFDPYTQRISIFFNYQIKEGSTVTLTVAKNMYKKINFDLIPLNGVFGGDNEYSRMYAVSEDGETDTSIVKALLNSAYVEVRAEGEGNTYSVDKYISEGFIKAYEKMREECSPRTF